MTRAFIGLTFSVAALSAQPAAAQTVPASAEAGTCIAIVLPGVQGVEGDATALGNSVRELFASFLRGPSMQVMTLDARLTAHALEEAKQKSCGRVLTVSLTRKRGGNTMGTIARVAGQAGASAAGGMGYGATVGAAAARGAANAATQVVNEAARSTKAKDEITIEYKITSDGREVGARAEEGQSEGGRRRRGPPDAARAARRRSHRLLHPEVVPHGPPWSGTAGSEPRRHPP